MAVDTKQKRGSAIGQRQGFVHVLPDADGSLSAADRQQVAFSYTGIASSSPLVMAVTKVFTLIGYVSQFTARGFQKVLTARAD